METIDWITKELAKAGIEVKETQEKGRHCVAAKDFPVGSIILAVDPEIDAPFGNDVSNHCSYCYKCLPTVDFASVDPDVPPEPEYRCPGCKAVFYCSEECRVKHWKHIHHKECNAINAISEMSIIIERVLNLNVDWRFLRPAPTFDPKNMSEEYTAMFDSLRSAMSQYENFVLPDNDTLYLLTETINNNAFAIEDSATNPAGTGIYLLASLFSHSCVANTSRAFRNKTLFVLATNDIKKGEEITVTYSSNIFNTVEKRREELYDHYGFRCNCTRCAAESDHSSEYYKIISGGCIPQQEAVIPLNAIAQVKDALVKKADAEDYKGEHALIAMIIPPGSNIPESYISCLDFAFIIEKMCVACNRLGISEDELFYTKLYGKCSECKYIYIYDSHSFDNIVPHSFLYIFFFMNRFLIKKYTHCGKHPYKLRESLLQHEEIRRSHRALQERRGSVQDYPSSGLCRPCHHQR